MTVTEGKTEQRQRHPRLLPWHFCKGVNPHSRRTSHEGGCLQVTDGIEGAARNTNSNTVCL